MNEFATTNLPIPEVDSILSTFAPENIREYFGVDDAHFQNTGLYPEEKVLLGGVSFQNGTYNSVIRDAQRNISGLDLFLHDDAFVSSEDLVTTNFTENIEDEDNLGTYNNAFFFSMNYITQLAFNPSPERSWIKYRCDITTIIDNHVITHTLLPKTDLYPKSVPEAVNTEFETNINETIPWGPDQLAGERYRSLDKFLHPYTDKEIQICGSPDVTIIIKGEAVRIRYEIIPPVLLRYGGKRCYQIKNIVTKEEVAGTGSDDMVNMCKWELHYILRNVPTGFLGKPNNPLLTDYEDTVTMQQNSGGILYQGVTTENEQVDLLIPDRLNANIDTQEPQQQQGRLPIPQ